MEDSTVVLQFVDKLESKAPLLMFQFVFQANKRITLMEMAATSQVISFASLARRRNARKQRRLS
jgi:hypothetical protein